MKKLLLLMVLSFSLVSFAQTDINDARSNYAIGQTVTITGVSANGDGQLGNIRYIQDATGGLPCYGVPTSFGSDVAIGDSVTMTGVLYDFNGLLEISPTNSYTIHSQVAAPSPMIIPITSANEPLEGRLLQIQNVTIGSTGNFAGNTNYTLTSGGNTLQIRINSSSNLVGTPIPTGPVSVTGLLSQFNTSYQLLPRMTTDIVPYVAPATEINVKIDGNDVLAGGSYFIGNSANSMITVENTGANTLTLSSAVLTGPNASEFTTTIANNSTVGGSSQQNYSLDFTPTGNGTRVATLTINNDDPDEGVYVINIEAVGLDNLASEPTANATGLTFTNVESYSMNGTFVPSATANNYIVLWKNGGTLTEVPVDGMSYMRGDIIGGAKVAYAGNSTAFVPRGIIANQNYEFAVYAFNGQGSFANYNTTSPAATNVTSLGENIGTYYNGINSSSATFLTDLSALINSHNVVSYFNYKTTMMSVFEPRDTTNGQSFVTCAYSGENIVYNDPFDWTATGYSREHTYAHSWMPTFPADGTNPKPEYSDMHNLYPTNLSGANSPRSNLPLDSITGNTVFTFLEGNVGYNGSQLVYEPRQSHKGNAARALFYMATCYNGISGDNWKLPTNQGQVSLKAWHYNDLPDNYEIARNEYIFSLQNNRNPFIDSVDFACNVDFSNMTYTNCGTNNLDELLSNNLSVFPVPAKDEMYVQVNGTTISQIQIVDISGKVVFSNAYNNVDVVELKDKNFSEGVYIVNVTTPFGTTARRVIIK